MCFFTTAPSRIDQMHSWRGLFHHAGACEDGKVREVLQGCVDGYCPWDQGKMCWWVKPHLL